METQILDNATLEKTAYSENPQASADLVRMLLRRLRRLHNIQVRCSELLNTEGMYLVNQTIFSTYSDCRALGISDEANVILNRS